jgi:5-oxoprolinase (ATP-hydrolysing)
VTEGRGTSSGGATPGIWRLAVDTGGTFTDCLGTDPDGRVRRAKVLSSAALRSRIVERLGPAALRVAPLGGGMGLPAGFFAGCTLRLLGPRVGRGGDGGDGGGGGGGGEEWRVVASGPEAPAGGPEAPASGSATAASDSKAAGSGSEAPASGSEAAANGVDGVDGGSRAGATLDLDRPLPPGALAGVAVELQAAEEAPVLAARLLTGTPPGRPLPPVAMRLATTRGTNALLERKGARVALFITRGFADLLRIGTQQRPDLFALSIVRPEPLCDAVVEVDERIAADGAVLRALDLEGLRRPAAALAAAGCRCAAVALLHSYLNPVHERRLGALLRGLGFDHVALSAELAPLIKLLPRAATAVVDSYLAPVLGDYLEAVAGALAPGALHLMTSAGGLVQANAFRAKDSLLSGPAGGVVGAAHAGRRSGFRRVIAFDMGGTSTDVARHDGDFEYLFEHRVGDAHLVAPALAIESVAAGGGSICSFSGGRLRVGPESAGARPGPACYGAGGPLTLTDVNLLLGRLVPERFEIPLDPEAAAGAAAALHAAVAGAAGVPAEGLASLLEGLLAIANERMAEAIRGISLRRGYDPGEYALVAFGGAGAQHACAVAELLGMTTVLVPADAGLLSALGLAAAVVERFAQRQVLAPLELAAARLDGWCEELGFEAAAAVVAEGVPPAEVAVRRRIVALRFAGQEATLTVDYDGAAGLPAAFSAAYRAVYGYEPEGRAIEVESLRVVASSGGEGGACETAATTGPATGAAPAVRSRRSWFGGRWIEVPAPERATLAAGAVLSGPALVLEDHTATVVDQGWTCVLDAAGALVLRQTPPRASFARAAPSPPLA